MKAALIYLFFIYATFSQIKADSDEEEAELAKNPALVKLAKLIEEHDLNVTVIVSESKYGPDQIPKSITALSVTMPPADSVTSSKLDVQSTAELLKLAAKEKMVAAFTKREVDEDGDSKVPVLTSNEVGELPTPILRNLLTEVNSHDKEMQVDIDEDVAIIGTYIVPGTDGKNETTKIIVGHLTVTVDDETENFPPEEMVFAKEQIRDIQFVYDDYDEKAKALVDGMEAKFKGNWQVIINGGDDIYVDSKKTATFKVLEDVYMLFTVSK